MIFRRIQLAIRQLLSEKTRLLAAIAGIAFANVMMFMQLGFNDALLNSASLVQQKLRGDLVIINTRSEALMTMRQFSRRVLYQALNHPAVEWTAPMYVGLAPWKNPWNGRTRTIFVIGIEPSQALLDLPGVPENIAYLRQSDTALFDRLSRNEFGDVPGAFARGQDVQAEVNRRRIDVKGLFSLGATFAADGTLLTSDLNFLRLFNSRRAEAIDVGVIGLQPGADVAQVKAALAREAPKDTRVLTRDEFIEFERNYWETSTAIGVIFGQGVLMGFIIGLVITYQILYTDVANHLPEYATLKAMGYSDLYLVGVVFQQSLWLSLLGYAPGIALTWQLYKLTAQATFLPMEISAGRAALVLALTVVMCFLSGLLAMRKLRQADPAEIF